jgi:NADPH-dependent ferric siderophore reductase
MGAICQNGCALQRSIRTEINLPVPSADGTADTLRVKFDDWMWLQSDNRLFNRAYMQRYRVVIDEVSISFEKLN